ncbi:HPr family phosphocarrier protein [Clostridia bacterium OttesenSCG-928-O13]|nr:HPr family phosphocarrier protein [Clostridia bacterium OttesenSCG-928-O13]
MSTVYVSLPTAEVVQEFVEQLSNLTGSFDLIAGSYILDARSLMGIFSLDLTKPIRLDMGEDTPQNRKAIQRFLADAPPAKTKNGEVKHGQ